MIACLYGRPYAPFVESAMRDLCAAAAAAGESIHPIAVEAAVAAPALCAHVHRLYVLPFDAPAESPDAAGLLRDLCPRAEIVPAVAAQDLCWDRLATQERLLDRGIPVPETLVSTDPSHLHEFVLAHRFAVLKDRYGCGGHGHLVVWIEDGQLVGDGGSHLYRIAPAAGGRRQLDGDLLTYPGPFYAQRLIATLTTRSVTPAQVLRAYVVDHHIVFWTERYRDRYERPSDWIVSASRGAKYRFLQSVSDEAQKVALRAAEVVGTRVGVVDMVRTGSSGPHVLGVGVDGRHMMIDRGFKDVPDYRAFFDFDRYVAEALLTEPPEPVPLRPPKERAGARRGPGRQHR
ncbi:hypothetical protein L6Q96_11525 [Candidatus Binatia bacterium]|nr:hypothetical protein [Candidatus Binatia bacterium]